MIISGKTDLASPGVVLSVVIFVEIEGKLNNFDKVVDESVLYRIEDDDLINELDCGVGGGGINVGDI